MILLFLLAALTLQQGPAQTEVGTLAVTVLEAGTNLPLEGAIVSVRQKFSEGEGSSTRTDANGGLTLKLPAGRYEVQVHSDTHLTFERKSVGGGSTMFGWASPSNPSLAVDIQEPGQAEVTVPGRGIQTVILKLRRGSEVVGRILHGDRPVGGATVDLVMTQKRSVLGRPVASRVGRVKSSSDGSFRFEGLEPDTYLLRAHPDHEAYARFSTVYHPGVLDVTDATRIDVGAASRHEVLFNFQMIAAVRVSGRVIDTGEAGVREVIIRRLDEETGDVTLNGLLPLKADGTWSSEATGSGVHALLYTRRSATGNQLLAAAWRVFYVGAEPLKDLDLQAVSAASLVGKVQFDGAWTPPDPEQLPSVYLRDASVGDSIRSGLSERGPTTDPAGFRINGIVGANIIDVDAPEGWIVEAVVLPDGRDILDKNFAFEPGTHYDGVRVILSDRVATIRGTLPAGYRLNPDSLWVVAFPEDEALRRVERNVKSSEVDAAGSFAIPDLRPGMSYLVSTCGWPCSSGYDAENLNEMAATATRIFIDRPGTFTVTLKTNSKVQPPATKRDLEGR